MLRLFQRAAGLALAPPPTRDGHRRSDGSTPRPSRSVGRPEPRLVAITYGTPSEVPSAPVPAPWTEAAAPTPYVVIATEAWPPTGWWRESRSRIRAEAGVHEVPAVPEPLALAPAVVRALAGAPHRRSLFARVALLLASVLISFIVVEAAAGRGRD